MVVATWFRQFRPDTDEAVRIWQVSKCDFVGRVPEVMNNAAGPTEARLSMENGEEPRAIAILHCIGSRDHDYHKYCSRVCCMYSLKFSHLVKEKTSAEVYQLYIDMRAWGKGYEEFYERILDEGVNIIRGKGAEVVSSGYRGSMKKVI